MFLSKVLSLNIELLYLTFKSTTKDLRDNLKIQPLNVIILVSYRETGIFSSKWRLSWTRGTLG